MDLGESYRALNPPDLKSSIPIEVLKHVSLHLQDSLSQRRVNIQVLVRGDVGFVLISLRFEHMEDDGVKFMHRKQPGLLRR